MLFDFARSRPAAEPATASVPRGVRVYAVGDIHGRLDLLNELLAAIVCDAAAFPENRKYIVFLGDYVDRGPDSRGVIDRLLAGPPPGFGTIHLRGNHEAALAGFLKDIRVGVNWLGFGGIATLTSYGVALVRDGAPGHRLQVAQQDLRSRLPAAHARFLAHLRPSVTIGGYHFVHAGVRPGVPLAQQDEHDVMWIREEFLNSPAEHGKVVVHGHTISPEPEVRPNRIGIDTGAYATGRLTALVLEGTGRRFLQTGT